MTGWEYNASAAADRDSGVEAGLPGCDDLAVVLCGWAGACCGLSCVGSPAARASAEPVARARTTPASAMIRIKSSPVHRIVYRHGDISTRRPDLSDGTQIRSTASPTGAQEYRQFVTKLLDRAFLRAATKGLNLTE